MFLQDVRRDSRECAYVSWICVDEEREGFGGRGRDGAVALLVGLCLTEESCKSMLREHDAWRDAVCVSALSDFSTSLLQVVSARTLEVNEKLLSRCASRSVPSCSLSQIVRRRTHDQAERPPY